MRSNGRVADGGFWGQCLLLLLAIGYALPMSRCRRICFGRDHANARTSIVRRKTKLGRKRNVRGSRAVPAKRGLERLHMDLCRLNHIVLLGEPLGGQLSDRPLARRGDRQVVLAGQRDVANLRRLVGLLLRGLLVLAL